MNLSPVFSEKRLFFADLSCCYSKTVRRISKSDNNLRQTAHGHHNLFVRKPDLQNMTSSVWWLLNGADFCWKKACSHFGQFLVSLLPTSDINRSSPWEQVLLIQQVAGPAAFFSWWVCNCFCLVVQQWFLSVENRKKTKMGINLLNTTFLVRLCSSLLNGGKKLGTNLSLATLFLLAWILSIQC